MTEKIAELRLDHIAPPPMPVFSHGLISDRLAVLAEEDAAEAVAHISDDVQPQDMELKGYAVAAWVTTLGRLLLRIERFRHGGALLLTNAASDVNVKYRISYPRLRESLLEYSRQYATYAAVLANNVTTYVTPGKPTMPTFAHSAEVVAWKRQREALTTLDGAIWLVSLLSRVDGLVLMDERFNVSGFGTEILTNERPESLLVAHDPHGTSTSSASYEHFGTRHRSMMRYIGRHPRALGFVASQDGGVRAFANRDGSVLMWENVTLTFEIASSRWPRRAGTA